MRVRRAHDARQRRLLLHDLDAALRFPYLTEQFAKQAKGTTLKAFGMWLGTRRCKVCKLRIPPDHEKCCSPHCYRRLRRWKHERSIKRRGGVPKHEFVFSVKEVISLKAIAERLEITEDEACRRAEVDVRRGKILAYRGPFGRDRIRLIGVPKGS